MLHNDATSLYLAMVANIRRNKHTRRVTDSRSPRTDDTYEALPGTSYVYTGIASSVVAARSVSLRWMTGSVLHFFAGTERAAPLRFYNPHADKYLEGDSFIGAYGAVAMPGIQRCIARLLDDPASRRAVVSLGGLDEVENLNLPRCISCLHFLITRLGLDLLVYQRSLSLSVMPYDCALLANILDYVATAVGEASHAIRWTVGSLHASATELEVESLRRDRNVSALLPTSLLADSAACWDCLVQPEKLPEPFRSQVLEGIRT